jgi:hypothetical protein
LWPENKSKPGDFEVAAGLKEMELARAVASFPLPRVLRSLSV